MKTIFAKRDKKLATIEQDLNFVCGTYAACSECPMNAGVCALTLVQNAIRENNLEALKAEAKGE